MSLISFNRSIFPYNELMLMSMNDRLSLLSKPSFCKTRKLFLGPQNGNCLVFERCFFPLGLAGDGGVMDGLRTELSAIVERSRIGDRKQQELEQIITRLEDEVSRYSTQTIQLEERLADKMAQIASLESKLGQRNLKVVDLQNELEEKITENNVLQREVRKKSIRQAMVRNDLFIDVSVNVFTRLADHSGTHKWIDHSNGIK